MKSSVYSVANLDITLMSANVTGLWKTEDSNLPSSIAVTCASPKGTPRPTAQHHAYVYTAKDLELVATTAAFVQ